MADTPPIIEGISALTGAYDGFIIDIWGRHP